MIFDNKYFYNVSLNFFIKLISCKALLITLSTSGISCICHRLIFRNNVRFKNARNDRKGWIIRPLAVSNCEHADNVKVNGPPFVAVPVVDILFIAHEKTHGLDVTRKIPAIAVKTHRYLRARISLVVPSSRSLRHASNAIVDHVSSWLARFAVWEFCRSAMTRSWRSREYRMIEEAEKVENLEHLSCE